MKIKTFIDLVVGYYHPSKKAGLNKFFAFTNALYLAVRCWLDDIRLTKRALDGAKRTAQKGSISGKRSGKSRRQ